MTPSIGILDILAGEFLALFRKCDQLELRPIYGIDIAERQYLRHDTVYSHVREHEREKILSRWNVEPDEVQVDIVSINSSDIRQVMFRSAVSASFTVLGLRERLPVPHYARVYDPDDKLWTLVHPGREFHVPAGQPFGFSAGIGGALYLLSVQAPPGYTLTDRDDFVFVNGEQPSQQEQPDA